MLRISTKKHRSFTLVEILIVIAIIGILAGIILVFVGPAREKGKDTKIESNMLQLQQLAENIYLDNGSYNNLECSVIDEATGDCTCNNESLETLCEDLLDQGSLLTIEKSSTRFCAYARLNSTYNCAFAGSVTKNFCVDSWGTNKKVGLTDESFGHCFPTLLCRAYIDFNDDGVISNPPDWDVFFAKHWGKIEGQPGYYRGVDMNSDRVINVFDLSMPGGILVGWCTL